jgi:hypothetical protein
MVSGPRPLELYTASVDEQGMMKIVPNDDNLDKFSITPVLSEAWSVAAVQAAARLAGK